MIEQAEIEMGDILSAITVLGESIFRNGPLSLAQALLQLPGVIDAAVTEAPKTEPVPEPVLAYEPVTVGRRIICE